MKKSRKKRDEFRGKFCFVPKVEYIKKYRFYPAFLDHRLDVWLKSMSAKGWHFVHQGLLFFYFEKGTPEDRVYFSTNGGIATISLYKGLRRKFPDWRKYEKKKSKLNHNFKNTCRTIEVDVQKIDSEYEKLVAYRNHICLREYAMLFLMSLLAIVAVILCW